MAAIYRELRTVRVLRENDGQLCVHRVPVHIVLQANARNIICEALAIFLQRQEPHFSRVIPNDPFRFADVECLATHSVLIHFGPQVPLEIIAHLAAWFPARLFLHPRTWSRHHQRQRRAAPQRPRWTSAAPIGTTTVSSFFTTCFPESRKSSSTTVVASLFFPNLEGSCLLFRLRDSTTKAVSGN